MAHSEWMVRSAFQYAQNRPGAAQRPSIPCQPCCLPGFDSLWRHNRRPRMADMGVAETLSSLPAPAESAPIAGTHVRSRASPG